MAIRITLLFIFLIPVSLVQGQAYFELNASLGLPMQRFRKATASNHIGASANIMLPFDKEVPNYQFGLNGSYYFYGYNWQDVNFNLDIIENEIIIDRVDVPLEILSGNSMLGAHGVLYVEGKVGKMLAYVKGLLGVRRIWTYSRVYDRSDRLFFDFYEEEEEELLFKFSTERSYVLSYGGGLGVKFFLDKEQDLAFTMGATYLLGGKANYYDRHDTQFWEVNVSESDYYGLDLFPEDLQISRPVHRSRISMFFLEIGIEALIE